MEAKTRNDYFDNLKGILIILVVLGHLLELLPRSSLIRYAYLLIYSFHMPLFILCTGYFSVGLTPRRAITSICYPYFVWQTIYFLFYSFVLGADGTVLSYASPIWLMWYLLSALLWFLLRPLFHAETKGGVLLAFVLSLVLGLLAGFDSSIHRYLSLSRTIVFFPFYLCGYYLHIKKNALMQAQEQLNGILYKRLPALGPRAWERRLLPAAILAAFACGAACLSLLWQRLDANWFYEANGYAPGSKQLLFRICHYALAVAVSLFLMLLTPKKHTLLSTVGENSVTVFLLHGLLVRYLEGRIPPAVYALSPGLQLTAALAFSFAVSLLFGNRAVKKALSPLLRFSLHRPHPDSLPSSS